MGRCGVESSMFPHLSSLDVLLLLGCGGGSGSRGILGLCLLGELLLLVLAQAVGGSHRDISDLLSGLSLLLDGLLLGLGGFGLEGLLGLGHLVDLGDPGRSANVFATGDQQLT